MRLTSLDAPTKVRRISGFYLVATIAGLAMTALILYPLGSMLLTLFAGGAPGEESAVAQVLKLPGLGQMLLNTALVVVVGGGLALLVGSVFAWLNERTDARMGWLSQILPIIPLLLPPIAAVIGWVFLLSPRSGTLNALLRTVLGLNIEEGPLNIFNWYGIIFVYVVELVPITYLVMSAALRNLDPSLEQAAAVAGAGPLKTLRKVTLPAIRPAIASAAWLTLTISLVIFSVPSVIGQTAGIDVLSTTIVRLLSGTFPPRIQVAVVLGTLMLACIAIAWLVQRQIAKASRYSAIGGKGVRSARVKLGIWKLPARVCMIAFLALATVIPVLGLLAVSVQRFWSARFNWSAITLDQYRVVLFESTESKNAILNSMQLGVIGATVGIALAFLVALLAHYRPSAVSRSIAAVAKLPAAFSHIVVAIGVLLVFVGPPFNLSGTIAILLIAYLVIYFPQASIAADAAVFQVDKSLVEASHISGAGVGATVRRIVAPLLLPALASGWALLFVYMAGDLTASVLLAGTATPTVGYLMLSKFNNGTYPEIAAFGLIVTLVSTTIVLTVLRLTKGKIGRMVGGG